MQEQEGEHNDVLPGRRRAAPTVRSHGALSGEQQFSPQAMTRRRLRARSPVGLPREVPLYGRHAAREQLGSQYLLRIKINAKARSRCTTEMLDVKSFHMFMCAVQ